MELKDAMDQDCVVLQVGELTPQAKGIVQRCFIKKRKGDSSPLFIISENGYLVPNLDGYAIVPREDVLEEDRRDFMPIDYGRFEFNIISQE